MAGLGLEAVRNDVVSSVQRMTGTQRVTLGFAFVATAIGIFLVARTATGTDMATLYANLDPDAAAEVVDELENQGVDYELANGGRTIRVPADDVHGIRLDLSSQNLPAGGEGWSILDDQGITTSEFDQRVGFQRAMEGELARTISAIDGVSDANVHLVIPDTDLFVGDDVQASASVLLVADNPQSITPMQVEAVVNLVASSVEGMTTDRVSVTDQSGRVLAAPGEGSSVVGLEGDSQLRARREFEAALESELEQLLSALVGPGMAMVNVAADLDFDSVVTVTEEFQPTELADGSQPVLSETTRQERYTNANGDLEAGVLGAEIPEIDDDITDVGAETGDGTDSSVDYALDERDAAYAVNKVVTNTENAVGEVSNLSVAVLLDEEGVDAARLAEIEELVTAAAGLNVDRGDTLAVELLPIDAEVRAAIEAANTPVEASGSGLDLVALIRTVLTGVVMLVVILFGLRYLRQGNRREVIESIELADAAEQLALGPGDDESAEAAVPVEQRLSALLANQPDDVAGVLRTWLADANHEVSR